MWHNSRNELQNANNVDDYVWRCSLDFFKGVSQWWKSFSFSHSLSCWLSELQRKLKSEGKKNKGIQISYFRGLGLQNCVHTILCSPIESYLIKHCHLFKIYPVVGRRDVKCHGGHPWLHLEEIRQNGVRNENRTRSSTIHQSIDQDSKDVLFIVVTNFPVCKTVIGCDTLVISVGLEMDSKPWCN